MEILNVFEFKEEEGIYYLLNRKGKRVPNAEWSMSPMLQSGVFLATYDKVFTVLGDEVKNLEADEIYAIINFWAYYRRGAQKYIARLEPLGLKFRIKVETPVEEVGFLSHDGCVIKNNGGWEIYNYDFGTLMHDNTIPDVNLTVDKVTDLLKKGFTAEYLTYLAQNNDDTAVIDVLSFANTLAAWEKTNHDFCKVIIKLSELIGDYSAEEIGSILGLKPYIISVITQYLEINNFVSSTDVAEKM